MISVVLAAVILLAVVLSPQRYRWYFVAQFSSIYCTEFAKRFVSIDSNAYRVIFWVNEIWVLCTIVWIARGQFRHMDERG